MLILIGTVPTAYALNKAVTPAMTQTFVEVSHKASASFAHYAAPDAPAPVPSEARAQVQQFVQTHHRLPTTMASMQQLTDQISTEVAADGSMADVPVNRVDNVRNNMYVMSEAIRLIQKSEPAPMQPADLQALSDYKKQLDNATKFIPPWVKVAVALALGLGTMVGWKRIVVTVGEKIGKQHLTYGQGASAELVAMGMIGAADIYGLPVSTTHVLASGVAGTMVANGSGLQWSTVRSLLAAWVLTLPASIGLAAVLYWIFHAIF
jgi:PiT family inorganic phosphate transporter